MAGLHVSDFAAPTHLPPPERTFDGGDGDSDGGGGGGGGDSDSDSDSDDSSAGPAPSRRAGSTTVGGRSKLSLKTKAESFFDGL